MAFVTLRVSARHPFTSMQQSPAPDPLRSNLADATGYLLSPPLCPAADRHTIACALVVSSLSSSVYNRLRSSGFELMRRFRPRTFNGILSGGRRGGLTLGLPQSEMGRRRGARGSGPFPSALSRTRRTSFPVTGSPVFISGWWLWPVRCGCSGGIVRRPRGSCVCVSPSGASMMVWVPNWSSTSCDLGVFVDQSTEQIATSDLKLRWRRRQ